MLSHTSTSGPTQSPSMLFEMLLSNLPKRKKKKKFIPDKNNNIEITIILKRIEKPMYIFQTNRVEQKLNMNMNMME